MGSVGNQNPWGAPYNTYKDCSQGICSIFCPQWCYIIFPPPPPFSLGDDDDDDDDDGTTDFSPLVIAIIGIMASAFILISYYTLISKYCRRRRRSSRATGNGDDGSSNSIEFSQNRNQNEAWQGNPPAGGLDQAFIKSITVCKYKKGDGCFIDDGTDYCSVCLSEFQENENLRLLPKCNHAFHLPCIDTWLKSHASCPLCRANIIILPTQEVEEPAAGPILIREPPPPTTTSTVSTLEYQQHLAINDSILVVDQDLEGRVVGQEAVVTISLGDDRPKTPPVVIQEPPQCIYMEAGDDAIFRPIIGRSVSMNFSSSCDHSNVSIADVLRVGEKDEIDDDQQPPTIRDREKNRSGILNMLPSPVAMKRSISSGRFVIARYEKGKSSVNPNPNPSPV